MGGRNFYYEQPRLENDRVALESFEPRVHIPRFVEEINSSPDILKYVSFPLVKTEDDFMREVYKNIRDSPQECLYAIIDKTAASQEEKSGSEYAGVVSLSSTNPVNAVTEIGAMIFPAYQRTHVTTNAIGLLLLCTLDPPSAGGLGLRRVEWKCHAENWGSRRIALRMGFEFEGIVRWNRVFPRGTVALPVEALQKRNGAKEELPGRHTAIFSVVWDEWKEKRANIVAQMERKL